MQENYQFIQPNIVLKNINIYTKMIFDFRQDVLKYISNGKFIQKGEWNEKGKNNYYKFIYYPS